jgi:hypothetical protein
MSSEEFAAVLLDSFLPKKGEFRSQINTDVFLLPALVSTIIVEFIPSQSTFNRARIDFIGGKSVYHTRGTMPARAVKNFS